jgi:hypothetical protein
MVYLDHESHPFREWSRYRIIVWLLWHIMEIVIKDSFAMVIQAWANVPVGCIRLLAVLCCLDKVCEPRQNSVRQSTYSQRVIMLCLSL